MNIHEFASRGAVDAVQAELRRGVPVDSRDHDDFTPLARAAESPTAGAEMLQLLLDNGADLQATIGTSRQQALSLAACSGDLAKTEQLIDAGADVNHLQSHDYSAALNIFFRIRDEARLLPMLQLLMRRGAIVDCESTYGESPLRAAYQRRRWDVVQFLLDEGADPSPLGWTKLMREIALGSADQVQRLLAAAPRPHETRDRMSRTPWLLSIWRGRLEMAQLIYASGVDVNEVGWCGETPLLSAAMEGNVAMIRWLLSVGADPQQADEMGQTPLIAASVFGHAAAIRALLDGGADPQRANPHGETPIALAVNVEAVQSLVAAGEAIGDVSVEMRRILTGLTQEPRLTISPQQYRAGRQREFGRANPEIMDVPFWRNMIRAGISAYAAKLQFEDTQSHDCVWSFAQFGASFTQLPGDRYVLIGGEHEDYYDPDFCIYNDVVLFTGDGEFVLHGYPSHVFPPTDFHSATLVGDEIYIIGGIGYFGTRNYGSTPIYRLNCQSWRIEAVAAAGENPGWIFRHQALLAEPGVILVRGGTVTLLHEGEEEHLDNTDVYELHLANRIWKKRAASQ